MLDVQQKSVGLVIKKLLTPGLILELAMRRCVLGKTLYAYSPLGTSSLPDVVAQLDERLANKTPKSALHQSG